METYEPSLGQCSANGSSSCSMSPRARTIRVCSSPQRISPPTFIPSVSSFRTARASCSRPCCGSRSRAPRYHRAYRRGHRRPELSGRSDRAVRQPEGVRGHADRHMDGGTPNIIIEIDARMLGISAIWSTFREACGISGYLLGVNPFNQPGVRIIRRICLHFWADRVSRSGENTLRLVSSWKTDRPFYPLC